MANKPTYLAAEIHSHQEVPSIFAKVKERSGAPPDSSVIFGQHAVEAIEKAGLASMTWKMIDMDGTMYKWCVFGPRHMRNVIEKFERDGGYSDMTLAEYLARIYSVEEE